MELGTLLSKACFLTVIGFFAVTLGGPLFGLAIALLSLLLALLFLFAPFLLVGLAIWLPFRLLECRGRRQLAAAQWPGRTCQWSERSGQAARRVGATLLEAVSGGLVGGFLGTLLRLSHGNAGNTIVMGALLGAGVGLLVGMRNQLHRPGQDIGY